MKLIQNFVDIPENCRGSAAALGNFDGIHPGHQAVIKAARAEAEKNGLPMSVISFEPHTREFFNPEAAPFRLTSLMSKARVLEALKVDILFVLPFGEAMASKTAEDFIKDILVRGLGVSHVLTGADFRFGRGRKGTSALLHTLGAQLGLKSTAVDLIVDDSEVGHTAAYSSTLIRSALRRGDVVRAASHLGRPWAMDGIVEHGEQRGRTIGFPTANVSMGRYLQPAQGVYAVRVEVAGGPHAGLYDGVANIGNRPTFGKKDVLLEAHLFDFNGDIYDQEIFIYFIDAIRPERKFDGLESLKTQIKVDCSKARENLATSPWHLKSLPL